MGWPQFIQPYVEVLLLWVSWAIGFVDLEYFEYLLWLFLPICLIFIIPIVLVIFIYGSIIFLHVYRLRHRIREAYASSYWDGARMSIASFWDGVGYVWHGYEIRGLENVPDSGPALFIYYHGTLPLDVYYVISKCLLHKKRTLHCVVDKFIFKLPGWDVLNKVFFVTEGTVEGCIKRLKDGHLLCIAPGGVREALFANPDCYNMLWAHRLGFAKVIIGSSAPVIPMFTENCRDSFRTPRWGGTFFRWLYEKTKLPLCPVYGGFPVKMITHLGKPIEFAETADPMEVKKRLQKEVFDLVRAHQRLPGSIFRGILQRFRKSAKVVASGGMERSRENRDEGKSGNSDKNTEEEPKEDDSKKKVDSSGAPSKSGNEVSSSKPKCVHEKCHEDMNTLRSRCNPTTKTRMESENSSAVKNTRSKGVAQSIQSKKITTTPAMGRVQQAPSFLQYRSPVDRRCISEVGNENLRRFLSRIPRSPASEFYREDLGVQRNPHKSVFLLDPQPIRSANVRPLNGQTKSSGKVQPEKPLDDGGCIQEDDDDDDEIISDQEKNEDEKKKEDEEKKENEE